MPIKKPFKALFAFKQKKIVFKWKMHGTPGWLSQLST